MSAALVLALFTYSSPIAAQNMKTNEVNSIRDDIEQYINNLPDTEMQKNALKQTARAFNLVLSINIKNHQDLNIASTKLSNASSCVFSRYPSSLANKRARQLEKLSINTKERFNIYDKFNIALSGTTSLSPLGDGCE